MAKKCEVCGKGPWFGKQVSFSHKRSSKKWSANIQSVRVADNTNTKKLKVCTSCLKAGKVTKV
jgi:large subunit ribosomal protein L28